MTDSKLATNDFSFDETFRLLTGNLPFPWQRALYQKFVEGEFPESCNLPTGLGKTSVIHLWLLALAAAPTKVPRRLVYVVNRRTVVDQSTDEAIKMRARLIEKPELGELAARLLELSVDRGDQTPLAISTLRGQFADNREWSADPSRPAVICGTVDMIGSRLLFSGYGCGFKSKPLHAGFLGQDVLLIHDEAHLEPAFQELLVAIKREQERCHEFRKFHVVELSATSRGDGESFKLSAADEANDVVKKRIHARKSLAFHPIVDEKKQLADQLVKLALAHKDSNKAILVFARSVETVGTVVTALRKAKQEGVQQLTGTLRGLERDKMADPRKPIGCPIFARFLRPPSADASESEQWRITPKVGTVYLVCTSAGEVGVNLSADHLVCDLSTYDSMAQRFGRVNRFGDCEDTRIDVVHLTEFDTDNEIEIRRNRTLSILKCLHGSASPSALGSAVSNRDELLAAFSPLPEIRLTSDMLFDAWSLTTIRDKLPGRPPVEQYLHGKDERELPQTTIAWRREVELFSGKLTERQIEEFLDECPIRSHEELRDRTDRVSKQLEKIATRGDGPVWVVQEGESLRVTSITSLLADDKDNLGGVTLVLGPAVGGLKEGLVSGDSADADDVADAVVSDPTALRVRLIVSETDEERLYKLVADVPGLPAGFEFRIPTDGYADEARHIREEFTSAGLPPMKVAFRIELKKTTDDEDALSDQYLVLKPIRVRRSLAGELWPSLEQHAAGVRSFASEMCRRLGLPAEMCRAIELAAGWHDLGKGRAIWQRGAGNIPGQVQVAKTLHGRPPENLSGFRHELGSLVDVHLDPAVYGEFENEPVELQDLILQLIASHHGRARPHFPSKESYDPERPQDFASYVVGEVTRRFARLRRRYGRWGLAYLESLVRAADALDSKRIDEAAIGTSQSGAWPSSTTSLPWSSARILPEPSLRVAVDPSNPGQFFACCGLFELANRLWNGVEAWFDSTHFCLRPVGEVQEATSTNLFRALTSCELTNTMTAKQLDRLNALTEMKGSIRDKTAGLSEEKAFLEELLRDAPIYLHSPFFLRLDWFHDDLAGGSRFKTWAGRQSVLVIASSMKNALNSSDWQSRYPDEWFSHTVRNCGLPFNFDADLGAQGSALDVGFSFDPLNSSKTTRIGSTARPCLELLAFIGLQRFRPRQLKKDNRYLYATWNRPLSPDVAAPAACGLLPVAGSQFEFRLLYRTKYLKSFLPSIPVSGDSND